MKYGPWYVGNDACIRRPVYKDDGTQSQERLPRHKYKHLLDKPEELTKFVTRLNDNAEAKAKKAVSFKHAFIDQTLLDEYRELLVAQIPSRERAQLQYYYLVTYFLNFFIGKLDLANPLDWHQNSDTKWAVFLTGPEAPKAASTKKEIVQAANRFMLWLHKKRPSEVPVFKFTPISRAKYKAIEAQRELNGEITERKFIPDTDMERIEKACPKEIAPYVYFGEKYGLRRSESLAVEPSAVRNAHCAVSKQIERLRPNKVFSYLKGCESRKVPHWFSTPGKTYLQAVHAEKYVIHPDTLTERWRALMEKLGMDYDFHDLRHRFITKAIRIYHPRDVQLAAGHKNIETTMAYSHDDRNSDDAPFKPAA